MERSQFATALERLLDKTGLFTRDEWAQFLGISAPAISQWTNDHTIPEPDRLNMILSVLRESDGVPKEILDEFDQLALKPSLEISPHGDRLDSTLKEYMLRPLFQGFLRMYACVPPDLKKDALHRCAEICRNLKRQRTREEEAKTRA
jgi:transcriptional regulator with XRE-family HTH domain